MSSTPDDQSQGSMLARSSRYVVISADTHCGAPHEVMRTYLDERFRDDFDSWLVTAQERREQMFRIFATNPDPAGDELDERRLERFESFFTGLKGYSDPDKWLSAQEADGIVASAIYPTGSGLDGVPFAAKPSDDDERGIAAMRAYNRWLGEFCSSIQGRGAGLAAVPMLHHVELVTEMIHEAAGFGLRGIMLPNMAPDQPAFNHPMYEPVWAACEEHGLTLNIHGGTAGPEMFTATQMQGPGGDGEVGDPFHAASLKSALGDGGVGSRRMMFTFVYGGIFDRFPTLRIAFTEAFLEWVPFERIKLSAPFSELWYNNWSLRQLRNQLERHPDDYWEDHFFFGASFMAPRETPLRHNIGVGQIMWGSDYPHAEGTHPHTLESLRNTFAGVPADELRLMLGENAARFYGFDLAQLRAIADRVGPTVAMIDDPIVELPDSLSYAFR